MTDVTQPVLEGGDSCRVVAGVAGKCCAGKDEVTHWLLDHGWLEINVDRIGHEALAVKHREIVAAFGQTVVAGGTIDRRALGRRVFQDPTERARLEAIVHPWMKDRVRERVEAYRRGDDAEMYLAKGVVINAALLFPMELDRLCDIVVLVKAPLWQRFARAKQRDEVTVFRIVQRLWSQRHLDAQALASPADTIIVENGRTRDALYQRLASLSPLSPG